MEKWFTKKYVTGVLLALLPLVVLAFLIQYFSHGSAQASICLTDTFCLKAAEMGKIPYILTISVLFACFALLLCVVAIAAKFATLFALFRKPFFTFGVIGSLSFFTLAFANYLKFKQGILSPFQAEFFPYMFALDILLAVFVIAVCVARVRAGKELAWPRTVVILTVFAVINVPFLNMLTIPSEVEGWDDVLMFLYVLVPLNLLLLYVFIIGGRKKKHTR